MKKLFLALFVGLLFPISTILAQDGANQIQYLNLAQQFSSSDFNGDPNASILPSVASENGYGSFLDNPASMAFIANSYFNVGYFSNQNENTTSFLGTSSVIDGQMGRISNVGLVYVAPTTQGSMVFGGGYTLNNTMNRSNLLSAYNKQSTITDVFKNDNSSYNGIAFDTYAIDYFDVEQTRLESIFRIGFEENDFPGIYQDAEITQSNQIGELSLFGATEFRKNLYLGVSFALVAGTHSYQRNFREQDTENFYDGDFLFQDDNGNLGTDIHSVLLTDEIDSEILGTTLRLGSVYQVTPFLNVGGSFVFPSRLFVVESYYSEIRSTFDDDTFIAGDLSGDFSYEIRKPAEFNIGVSLLDIGGFTASASLEFIDYSTTEVDLISDPDLDFDSITALREDQDLINNQISLNYLSVVNSRVGAKYKMQSGLEFRAGYSFLPGKSSVYEANRSVYAAGLGVPLTQDIFLDVSTQFSEWNDRSVIYESFNSGNQTVLTETVDETLTQWNILVGLKFRF